MASSASGPDGPSGADASPAEPKVQRRRSLRAVFAADIAGFSGRMSLNETSTVNALSEIRAIGRSALDAHQGWLFGMPGDGLFATFESAVSAVQCALDLQLDLETRRHLQETPLRIGIHLGEVIIEDGLPYGETLNIAARLESLADPGGILVSGTVMDAVSARVSATFEDRGVPALKNIPRRIPTFAVKPPPARTATDKTQLGQPTLDRTTRLDRSDLRQILDTQGDPVVADDRPENGQSAPQNVQEDDVGAASTVAPVEAPRQMPSEAAAPVAEPEQADEDLRALTLSEKLARLPDLPPAPSGIPLATDPSPPTLVSSEPQLEKTLPELPPETPTAPEAPTPALVAELTKALAVHVGPFSKLIVERETQAELSVFELISKLEEHIPNEDERLVFRVRASHINASMTDSDDGA